MSCQNLYEPFPLLCSVRSKVCSYANLKMDSLENWKKRFLPENGIPVSFFSGIFFSGIFLISVNTQIKVA